MDDAGFDAGTDAGMDDAGTDAEWMTRASTRASTQASTQASTRLRRRGGCGHGRRGRRGLRADGRIDEPDPSQLDVDCDGFDGDSAARCSWTP